MPATLDGDPRADRLSPDLPGSLVWRQTPATWGAPRRPPRPRSAAHAAHWKGAPAVGTRRRPADRCPARRGLHTRCPLLLAQAVTDLLRPCDPAGQAWLDFQARPAEYTVLLAEIVGLTANLDAAEGHTRPPGFIPTPPHAARRWCMFANVGRGGRIQCRQDSVIRPGGTRLPPPVDSGYRKRGARVVIHQPRISTLAPTSASTGGSPSPWYARCSSRRARVAST